MISVELEVNEFAKIRLILEAKFRNDPYIQSGGSTFS